MDIKLMVRLVKKSYSFMKPHMLSNIIAIILNQMSVVLVLLVPLMIKYLVDDLLVTGDYAKLFYFGISFIGIYAFSNLFSFFSNYIYANFAESVVIEARDALFSRLLNMKMSFFTTEKIGDIVSRLRDDASEIHTLLSFILDNILINVVKIVIIFIILFRMNALLATLAIISIPIYLGVNKYFSTKLRKQAHITRQKYSDLMTFFVDSFSKIILIKNFCAEDQEQLKHDQHSKSLKQAIIKGEISGYFLNSITLLVTNISSVMILWVGGYQVLKHNLTVGELIAYYTYLKHVYDPILSLTQYTAHINRAIASMERYFTYYEMSEVEDKTIGIPLKNCQGSISVSGLNFKYSDEDIYRQLDLEIGAGEKVLFLGKSGEGKTTLAYILKKFYEPYQGSIWIDGQDLSQINLRSLRMGIGMLPQEAFIMEGTIRENLKIVKEDATDEEMWRALEQAEIADWIRTQLKNGLDESLGNNGASLSGGQKQRLSIARLFLQNPKIVIFDELLTGLDIETEQRVWKNIKDFVQDKTVIFITHKIIEPGFFDYACLVEQKSVIKYSSFDELIKEHKMFDYNFLTEQVS